MEWIIVIYLIVGFFKAVSAFGNPNPALRPAILIENPPPSGFTVLIVFIIWVVFWPFTGGSR